MDIKTKKFHSIFGKLEEAIIDFGSSFPIAVEMTADKLEDIYEDSYYNTQVVIHEDFTATVNQYIKSYELMPSEDELVPYVDKSLIPARKSRDLPAEEVLPILIAIMKKWFKDFLLKLEKGIKQLSKLGCASPSEIELLSLLTITYEAGKSLMKYLKTLKNSLAFVQNLQEYLAEYCDSDKMGKNLYGLRIRMRFESTVLPRRKKGRPKTNSNVKDNINKFIAARPNWAGSKTPWQDIAYEIGFKTNAKDKGRALRDYLRKHESKLYRELTS